MWSTSIPCHSSFWQFEESTLACCNTEKGSRIPREEKVKFKASDFPYPPEFHQELVSWLLWTSPRVNQSEFLAKLGLKGLEMWVQLQARAASQTASSTGALLSLLPFSALQDRYFLLGAGKASVLGEDRNMGHRLLWIICLLLNPFDPPFWHLQGQHRLFWGYLVVWDSFHTHFRLLFFFSYSPRVLLGVTNIWDFGWEKFELFISHSIY